MSRIRLEPKFSLRSILNQIKLVFIQFIIGKEIKTMAVVYATLIVRGAKEFSEVPAKIKEQVKQVLIDLDCAELAE